MRRDLRTQTNSTGPDDNVGARAMPRCRTHRSYVQCDDRIANCGKAASDSHVLLSYASQRRHHSWRAVRHWGRSNFAKSIAQGAHMATGKQTGSHKGESSNLGNDPEKAGEAGKKGGAHSQGSQHTGSHQGGAQQGASQHETSGSRGGSANFANDPERASEAGKKGGAHSHGGSQQSGSHQGGAQQGGTQHEGSGSRGGSANVSNDHEKAGEAGKKGGEHPRGGK